MSTFSKTVFARVVVLGGAAWSLSACADGLDLDLRGGLGNRFDTSQAANTATQDRPIPDARGIITYPNYQVAVARRGDTVASVATRIGVVPEELARYNGLSLDTELRRDEVLALPGPVSALPGAPAEPGGVDINALATGAIDSSPLTSAALPAAQAAGPEPVRHQVARGETAFTIARLYNVSVRSLADWNGLDRNFSVREGQFLLIPVAEGQAPDQTTTALQAAPAPLAATTSQPGQGSPTPTPPSAVQPLPEEETTPVAAPIDTPPAPVLPAPTQTTSAPAAGKFAFPVQGPIVREYAKGKNDGIGIGASSGTSVTAADSGQVMAVTETTEDQTIVIVQHPDNVLTVYANIDNVAVKKGDSVSRGQKIAAVRDGFVHFEVREGFDSVDPLPYLQ